MKMRDQKIPTTAGSKQIPDDKIDYSALDRLQVTAENVEKNLLKAHENEHKKINEVDDDFLQKIVGFIEKRIEDDKVEKELIATLKGKDKVDGIYSCKTIPSMSVCHYLCRLHRYTQSKTQEIYIAMLIYIDRYLAINKGLDFLNPYNVHRLILLSLLLAIKFLDDRHANSQGNDNYLQKQVARVGGIPLSELNDLEVDFFAKVNFNLYFSLTLYKKFENELNGIFNPDQKAAFLMGLHKRLGKESPVSTALAKHGLFDENVLKLIFSCGAEPSQEAPVKPAQLKLVNQSAPPGGPGF